MAIQLIHALTELHCLRKEHIHFQGSKPKLRSILRGRRDNPPTLISTLLAQIKQKVISLSLSHWIHDTFAALPFCDHHISLGAKHYVIGYATQSAGLT